MTYAARSLRLYLSNRTWVLGTPLLVLVLTALISIIIAAIFGISYGLPLSPSVQQDLASNGGAIFSTPGFLVSLGVLAMNRNFALALALGSTRRHFWLGTALGFLLTSLVTGAGAVGFLGIERLTDHWFIGARAFDVTPLGNGDPLRTFVVMAAVAAASLFIGALFGTVYRAFGTVPTVVLIIASVLLVLGIVAVVVWQWASLAPAIVGIWTWLLALLLGSLGVIAAGGSYAANRYATV